LAWGSNVHRFSSPVVVICGSRAIGSENRQRDVEALHVSLDGADVVEDLDAIVECFVGCGIGVRFCVSTKSTLGFNDNDAFTFVFQRYGGMGTGRATADNSDVPIDDVARSVCRRVQVAVECEGAENATGNEWDDSRPHFDPSIRP
jgi:hypothetical protein